MISTSDPTMSTRLISRCGTCTWIATIRFGRSKVIRGPESNDAVTIINGEVSSRTWGNTIKYILFKGVGYTPKKVEEQAGSADFAQNKGKKPPTDTNFA